MRLATGAVWRCARAAAIAGCALAYAAETLSSKLPRAKKFAPLLGERHTVIFFSPATSRRKLQSKNLHQHCLLKQGYAG